MLEERHRASEEAARMAAAAKQRAHSMHQIQAQQESEAKKKFELLSEHFSLTPSCYKTRQSLHRKHGSGILTPIFTFHSAVMFAC